MNHYFILDFSWGTTIGRLLRSRLEDCVLPGTKISVCASLTELEQTLANAQTAASSLFFILDAPNCIHDSTQPAGEEPQRYLTPEEVEGIIAQVADFVVTLTTLDTLKPVQVLVYGTVDDRIWGSALRDAEMRALNKTKQSCQFHLRYLRRQDRDNYVFLLELAEKWSNGKSQVQRRLAMGSENDLDKAGKKA